MENVEETLKIEEYSNPWYFIDLWSSNFWKKNKFWRKESSFFWKISMTALEKNSLREEHILLTLFTNTTGAYHEHTLYVQYTKKQAIKK